MAVSNAHQADTTEIKVICLVFTMENGWVEFSRTASNADLIYVDVLPFKFTARYSILPNFIKAVKSTNTNKVNG